MHCVARLAGQSGVVAGRAHDHRISRERRISGDVLGQRTIEDRASLLAEGSGLDVLHQSDDFVRHPSTGNPPANGIFVVEEPLAERFVDHRHTRRGRPVVAKITSGHSRNAHRLEVAWCDHVEVHAGTLRGKGAAFNAKPLTASSHGEGQDVGAGHRRDARKGTDTLAQFVEKLCSALGAIAVQPRVDSHREHAVGVEPDVDSGRALEAS